MFEKREWSSAESSSEDKTAYDYESNRETKLRGPRTSKHRKKVRYTVYLDMVIMLFLLIYVTITVGVYIIESHLNPHTTIEGDYANTGTKMVWMLQLLFSTVLRVLELLVDVQLLKATKRDTNPSMARNRASSWFTLKSFTAIISAVFLAILFVSPLNKWPVNFRVEQVIFSTILVARLLSLFIVYLFLEELQLQCISMSM